METSPHLSLLTFFSLFLLTQARLILNPSDLKALSIIQKHLGLNGHQPYLSTKPYITPGVFCERRLSNNHTYELRVTRLVFKSQRLTGFLSPAIGRLSELKELSVPNNQLVDQVPSQIVDCRKLEILNLQSNQFSGEIPSELSSLIRLRVLDLASNRFSGDLGFLKYFPNLENLSLADNLFTGKIPPSIRSFRNLRLFNFSGNQFLEGSAPLMDRLANSASDVPKRYILAENSTGTGRSNTTAPAANRTAISTAPAPFPGQQPHKHKNSKGKLAGWILGFLAGISVLIFCLLYKLTWAVVKGGGKEPGPSIFSPLIKKAEDLAFLEKEDGLASFQIVGRGGCGVVYKAELPGSNGKMIAIKKITQPPMDAAELTDEDTRLLNSDVGRHKMRQIRSEIKTVGRIRHRNLLPLLAHMSWPDCHYLVYEFMKSGSLQDMFNPASEGSTRDFDWFARLKVAIGVAAGLEYLHMNLNPRIIHRDLKPANVLLDDDMEAQIADFGLAKAMPDANTHMSSVNVAGTVGYIAPEYYQTLNFTDRCDIYSFGVLLGVLVMGKLPSDNFFQETKEMSLVRWMRNVLTSENPRQALDPKLLGNGFEEEMLMVLKIACFCTMDDPKQRPNSKDVRCMLLHMRHYLGSIKDMLENEAK
ncbi:leucine-rich repeat receptor-like serine/threonine/tyrosine-protein kinase SOBIR1 [Alnus glutinosa]|uniref:leucine-rich repeat receptor-like serine/threonine/tyrosine-protein kinase SOBIR1 n=1 Tax=Alnus glutinosa TaxID=3517 RepID=UPI002D767610|nr:leucine-rich repeat receptor-like serine/threonine/tyrosine-protein kinase SOBIR1 [Alnus glutinosa]